MKLIIAGGRDFNNGQLLISTLVDLVNKGNIPECPELVCGMARGADMLAYRLWADNNMVVHQFVPDWNGLGKRAGFVRNTEMAEFADALVAFWDGKSKGTKHMIDTMKWAGKPVYEVRY